MVQSILYIVNISAEEKEQLLIWLSSDDDHSDTWHGTIVEKRAKGSGIWFLKKFEEWLKDDSKMLLLCIGKRTSICWTCAYSMQLVRGNHF